MHKLVVAFDVGGTNSRARIASVNEAGASSPVTADVTARGASAREFYDFVSEVVEGTRAQGTIVSAVVAMAGLVEAEQSNITNWPSDRLVEKRKLVGAGLPADRTNLVNDVVAGVWGARSRLASSDPATCARRLDRPQDDAAELGDGNIVYVAPGTGLGTAALVRHGLGPLGASTVACETQHVPLPRFWGEISQIVDALSVSLDRAPDWEDLVSGRGLVNIYESQRTIVAADSPAEAIGDARDAGAIARAAYAGDEQALAATDAFYRTLGHYVQMMALTFLPCAAVVIGGATTESNLELLRRGGLAETFASHRRFGEQLREVPIYTVGGDVNLEGGIWLAARV